ncbi:MAG: tetratricopeptide repeat protein [Chitinophagaceae bacterium]|nr:tetratricopeptide repeat protein [Chitinophagaceae bacterium]MCW5905183.1 tetratricopeptide repeat protein [Chitinophagaceae bacterium]
MHQLKKKVFFIIAMLLIYSSNAQYSAINNDPDIAYKTAKEYWQKEQYSLAYPIFKSLVNTHNTYSTIPAHIQAECKYYVIVCGLLLNDETIEKAAINYVNLEYNEARAGVMSYHLGEYFYRKKDFNAANIYYEKASIENLTNYEIAEMKFHQAYGYFTIKDFAKAKTLFNSIRQLKDNANYIDANYYYGFILFYEKKYTSALESFKIVETSPTYQNIVPFYIAEIYYFNGERDKAIEYAKNAVKKGNQYYDIQLKQLIGHALFEKRNYQEALPYLEEYVNKSDKVRREDLYELSYCYYEANMWDKAITGFKQLGGKEDSLAQNSMYLLADAYLKTGDKIGARNAFLFCASNSSNAVQKEVSLFNYAKLSYELGYMDIALKELKTFINTYPTSSFINEAKELQVAVLANTSNYKEALVLLESLPQQSNNTQKIYPKILYGRVVELINDQQLNEADELLSLILQVPYNNQYVQFVYFWKGEIAYRNGKTEDALNYFNNYLKNPITNGEINKTNAQYNTAYCHLKKENYTTALDLFQQVVIDVSSSSSLLIQDAYIRSADCYFMMKNFAQATKMYDEVINQNLSQADYAMYQKAIIAGANNKPLEKVSILQNIPIRYPNSSLIIEAYLEVANTYLAEEKWTDAIPYLDKIINNKNATALHPKAYLKKGIAYFNLPNNQASLNTFKTLIVQYPNSPESDDAVEYIRKLFIDDQKPGEFVTFMRTNGKAVSYVEEDSLTYKSALIRYESRDFPNALKGFAEYISKFPDGRYAIEANYFSAEINVSNKNYQAALPFYNAVAAKAPNIYAERSALQSARIYYFDNKDYVNAEKYFQQVKGLTTQQENKLEAMRGLLRCQYKLQKWTEAVPNAQDLLKEKGIAADDKMMANMIIAKNHQLNNNLNEAMTAYHSVIAIAKSELSAEAQYRIAEILLLQNKLTDAEKAGMEVIKKYGSYEYWVTKSYILLGDIYFVQKDYFNAEATFKSVAENSNIEELKQEAENKLAQVIEEKNKVNKVEHQ